MNKVKVLAPNDKYCGVSASVPFTNGEGYLDISDEKGKRLAKWFKSKGYHVEDPEVPTVHGINSDGYRDALMKQMTPNPSVEGGENGEHNNVDKHWSELDYKDLVKFAQNLGFEVNSNTGKDAITEMLEEWEDEGE